MWVCGRSRKIVVSPGDPAASGLLKINKTAFSSITVLVGLIISSRPGGTLCTPRAPSSVGITFCTYLAGVHGPLMHMPGRPISSATQSCPTLCDPMDCSTPWTGLPVHHQLPEFPKLMSVESLMLSNHLILCCPFLLPPSIFPSTRVFSNESALHIRWPKDWSFSVNISPSNEHSGLTSFRMDWLYLLEVQGTLKSLLQHHSSKASILKCSAFFTVQLSHPYMTTGKTIALTRWTFVGKVMSLLFNMLSMLVITFLPSSKRLLISWLQSLSAVILEPPKIKSATVSTVCSSICHEVMGPDAMILVFWMLSFKPTFSLSTFTFIKRLFSFSLLSAICFLPLEWYHLHIWGCYYFSQQSWFQLVIHPAWHFTA